MTISSAYPLLRGERSNMIASSASLVVSASAFPNAEMLKFRSLQTTLILSSLNSLRIRGVPSAEQSCVLQRSITENVQ